MNHDKLIADFMGFTHEKNIGWYDNEMLMPQKVYDNQGGNCFDEVLFGTSWDWLMTVVQKCYDSGAEGECIGDITMHLTEGNIEGTYRAVVEYIEGLSVEPDTKATDESFFAGFCHALEYVKTEIVNVDDIEHEVDESVGDLCLSGTITIQLDQHLDADGLVDEVMRKYERDTTKDGSNI